jgi:hypothetical protein
MMNHLYITITECNQQYDKVLQLYINVMEETLKI